MKPMQRCAGGLLLSLFCVALGCGTSLDLERARRLFGPPPTSDVPVLVDSPAADLPAPTGVRTTSGSLREIPVRWDPILAGRVGGYVVERALQEGGPFERVAVLGDRLDTVFIDRGFDLGRKTGTSGGDPGLGDGSTYFYRVGAFDPEGHVSAARSTVVAGSTAPVPARPEGVRAYSHLPRRVAISWQALPDPTVAGYVLYRSPSSEGPFEPIARLRSRNLTNYVDRGLGDLRVFYYRVAAVNAAGGEGPPSAAVRALTKPDPLPPTGLHVEERALGVNHLAWAPNVERDLAGYRLLRRRDGSDDAEVVAELPASATRAEDRSVEPGGTVFYSLVAFDTDGLNSAPCEPVSVTNAGYELQASARKGAVELHFAAPPDTSGAVVRVLRLGHFRDAELARVKDGHYVDSDVDPGGSYRYAVALVRADGSEAPESAPVEARVPE
jgi:fibronectin type 3 domain-containing protein